MSMIQCGVRSACDRRPGRAHCRTNGRGDNTPEIATTPSQKARNRHGSMRLNTTDRAGRQHGPALHLVVLPTGMQLVETDLPFSASPNRFPVHDDGLDHKGSIGCRYFS